MMKQHLKLSLIAAALAAAGAARASDYVTASGAPLRTAFGECVRTGYWTAGSGDCDAKPVAAAATQPRYSMATVKVFFGFDEGELDENGRRALDALAEELRGGGVQRVVAIGHADALGPDEYNQRLSELRVKAVRDYLLEKGLPMHAFSLEAKGKREPATTGACEGMTDRKDAAKLIACLAPDRRVEVEVVALRRPLPKTASAGE